MVSWQGHDEVDATWETINQFWYAYPHIEFEDKLIFQGGSDVINAFIDKQYQRHGEQQPNRTWVSLEIVLKQKGKLATGFQSLSN